MNSSILAIFLIQMIRMTIETKIMKYNAEDINAASSSAGIILQKGSNYGSSQGL